MDRYSMTEDMKNAAWFVEKVKNSKSYAQNLYCAMCNMQWQKAEVMPILKDELWSASWRSSGGIVADLRNQGEDYLDYYCSGIKGGMSYDPNDDDEYFEKKGYVSEGDVTDEIREDLAKLGWRPVPYDDKDLV
jgi:hypothetical protein